MKPFSFFHPNGEIDSIRSDIFSLYITPPNSLEEITVQNLSKNIMFCHNVEKRIRNNTVYSCQYSKILEGKTWASTNCKKENEYFPENSEEGIVLCGCNHMTEFAVVESFNTAIDQTNADIILRSDKLGSVEYFKTEGKHILKEKKLIEIFF